MIIILKRLHCRPQHPKVALSRHIILAVLFPLLHLASATPIAQPIEESTELVPTFDSHEDYIAWRDERLAVDGRELFVLAGNVTDDYDPDYDPDEEFGESEPGAAIMNYHQTIRVGDGNPHQDHFHMQLTVSSGWRQTPQIGITGADRTNQNTLHCGDGDCSVGRTHT